jgi:hypothetical protein
MLGRARSSTGSEVAVVGSVVGVRVVGGAMALLGLIRMAIWLLLLLLLL